MAYRACMLLATLTLLTCAVPAAPAPGAARALELRPDLPGLEGAGAGSRAPGAALPAADPAGEPPGAGAYEPRWDARLGMASALVVADAILLELFVSALRADLFFSTSRPTLALAGLLVLPPAAAALAGGTSAAYPVGLLVHTAAVAAMAVAPPASLVLGLALDAWATPAVMDRVASAAARQEARAARALPVRDPATP